MAERFDRVIAFELCTESFNELVDRCLPVLHKVTPLNIALGATEGRVGYQGDKTPDSPIKCVYGKPFGLPSNGRARADELDELTDLIMCHIAALLEPEYRGAYADHPKLKELLAAQA